MLNRRFMQKKCCLLVCLLLCLWARPSAFAQLQPGGGMSGPADDSFIIWFPASSHVIDADFRGNGLVMDRLRIQLGALKEAGVETVDVTLYPLSSPDGNRAANAALSIRRGKAVESWLQSLQDAPKMVISMHAAVSTWDDVKSVPREDFRRCAIALTFSVQEKGDSHAPAAGDFSTAAPLEMPEEVSRGDFSTSLEMTEKATVIPTVVEESPWSTSWYLKTNFLTYPLNLTANLAVEVEIGRHFSVSVPFYYSALNWFKNNIKFRVAGSQPEVRYWFRRDFTGFYVAAHATFGWYNVAVGGRYRYQDHATKSPVFGGGINAGYRLPFGNSRWALEFSLGAGYMPLYYDTFFNVENGALAEEGLWKHYWGPDHAAVTLSFRFGKRRNHE